ALPVRRWASLQGTSAVCRRHESMPLLPVDIHHPEAHRSILGARLGVEHAPSVRCEPARQEPGGALDREPVVQAMPTETIDPHDCEGTIANFLSGILGVFARGDQ